MSLIRFAVRLCTARALRDATLAEGRVFISEIDPLDVKVRANRAPMITVNTDDHRGETVGRDMTGAEARLDLVIETAIASGVKVDGEDRDGETVEVQIHDADPGMDLTLDILEHQVTRALLRGRSEWAALWKRAVMRVTGQFSRRGADAQGVRFAARQLTLTCDTLADPVGGEDLSPGTFWGDLIAQMETVQELSHIAALLRAVISGDDQNPEWERMAAMIGINGDDAKMIGIGQPVLDEDGEPVTLEDIEFLEGIP